MIDQAELSSYVTTILVVVLGYTSGSVVTRNDIIGAVTAFVCLCVIIWNEAHNSTFISGKTDDVDYSTGDVEEEVDDT